MAYQRGSGKTGRVNMKRVEGGWMNQHGVVFTDAERKAMQRATRKSNAIVNKQIAEADARSEHAKDLRLMGKKSDFIISHQTKKLQDFKSKENFENFMDKQSRIQTGEYLDDRTRLYKRNYMQALDNVFGDEAKGIKMKIRMMKPEEYRKMVENDEFLEIGYLYDPDALEGKKAQIRKSLGMKPEDEMFQPL